MADSRVNVQMDSHFHAPDMTKVHAALWNLQQAINKTGEAMSQLSEAVEALKARVTEDFDRYRALLDDALATETADKARIADLTSQADALQAEISDAIANMGGVDPDPNFPAPAEPDANPQPEPPVVGG